MTVKELYEKLGEQATFRIQYGEVVLRQYICMDTKPKGRIPDPGQENPGYPSRLSSVPNNYLTFMDYGYSSEFLNFWRQVIWKKGKAGFLPRKWNLRKPEKVENKH